MDIETAVKGALDVRGRIEQNFKSPDALSDLITKLSAYNAHIGDEVGRLELELAEERTAKHYQYTNDGDLSESAAKTKIDAEQAIKKAEQKNLKIMHSDCKTIISTIQSRIKVLQEERRYG